MGNKSNKKITFVTPTLDRKGSEIALINLLKHIDKSFDVTLIAKYKGVLFDKVLPEMKKLFLFNGKPKRNLFSRITGRLEVIINTNKVLSKEKETLLYINTVILPDILAYAEKHKIRTIVHLHELEQMYSQLTDAQIKRLVTYPYLIIANSAASAAVIAKFGRKDNVKICYPCVETDKIKPNKEDYFKWRQKLDVKDDEFLWVMSGSLDENKNPFLFIEIAKVIIQQKKNAMFLWLGGTANQRFQEECEGKTNVNLLAGKIIWAGDAAEDYMSYFNCADGFVLTSIKESFSLVTVEALLLGLPVVTQNCGGVVEILRDDIGKVVVEKNNAEKMAAEMIKFMDGTYSVDKPKQLLRAKEFDVAVVCKQWNEILLQ